MPLSQEVNNTLPQAPDCECALTFLTIVYSVAEQVLPWKHSMKYSV